MREEVKLLSRFNTFAGLIRRFARSTHTSRNFSYTFSQHMFDFIKGCVRQLRVISIQLFQDTLSSDCPFIHWSVPRSIHLSVYPSVCPSIRLSVCPSVRPSICLSVCPSVRR